MTVSSPTEVAPPPPPVPITSTGTGIANLPNQRHKIVAKNGANFTLMVCGMSLLDVDVYLVCLFLFISGRCIMY